MDMNEEQYVDISDHVVDLMAGVQQVFHTKMPSYGDMVAEVELTALTRMLAATILAEANGDQSDIDYLAKGIVKMLKDIIRDHRHATMPPTH